MGRPHQSTIMTDDFLALTLDVWSIPPERARRVGHPAPFPVELPEQLIRLYTFETTSSSTRSWAAALPSSPRRGPIVATWATTSTRPTSSWPADGWMKRARRRTATFAGRTGGQGLGTLGRAGPHGRRLHHRPTGPAHPQDRRGGRLRRHRWRGRAVVVRGGWPVHRLPHGMARTDVVWKSLGRASALRTARGDVPLVFLTTQLLPRQSEGDMALRAAGPELFYDAVELLSADGLDRLSRYAEGDATDGPHPGFWTGHDLPRRRSPPGR